MRSPRVLLPTGRLPSSLLAKRLVQRRDLYQQAGLDRVVCVGCTGSARPASLRSSRHPRPCGRSWLSLVPVAPSCTRRSVLRCESLLSSGPPREQSLLPCRAEPTTPTSPHARDSGRSPRGAWAFCRRLPKVPVSRLATRSADASNHRSGSRSSVSRRTSV
jgi:hypothetical protein